MMKDTSAEQRSKREWPNPWKKNPVRPVKYKDISYRLLGEDSWKLSHSVCSGFALFCTHLVLPMVGDWILGEMDILADLIVILVYFGILFSGKMQME